MKKISMMALTAMAALVMTSCGNSDPKANMKSEIDSLSYAFGIINAAQLENQVPVDSAYTAEFFKGVKESFNAADDKKKAMYYLGIQVGQYLNEQVVAQINNSLARTDSTLTLSRANFLAGFLNRYQKQGELMTGNAADSLVNVTMTALREKAMEKEFGTYKADNEKYIEEKTKEEGVQKTESGLLYRVIKEGNGDVPQPSDKVKVHYEGRLIDGTVFDSSIERGEPAEFPVGGVIPGFSEALKLMPVGSEWEIYIPQNLAYGAQQAGQQIKPFSALTFKVQLLEIVK